MSSEDATLTSLQKEPVNSEMCTDMMNVCLNAVIAVLERQYKKYFAMDIIIHNYKEKQNQLEHTT